MARVEIDERAFSDPRLKQLCRKLQWPPREAIGTLAILWHDSQDQMIVEATAEDIDTWLGIDGEEAERIRRALLQTGYIEDSGVSDSFVINGNQSRVQKVQTYKTRAKEAAQARWGKGSKKKTKKNAPSMQGSKKTSFADESESEKTATKKKKTRSKKTKKSVDNSDNSLILDTYPVCSKHAQASQPSMDQAMPTTYNIQQDKLTDVAKATSSPGGSGVQEFIAAYCRAYKARRNHNPVMTGQNQGIAKRLVKDLGKDKAVALVQVYMQMNDSWFETRSYNLVTFKDNLDKVARYMETGQTTSRAMAQKVELFDDNKSVAQKFLKQQRGG